MGPRWGGKGWVCVVHSRLGGKVSVPKGLFWGGKNNRERGKHMGGEGTGPLLKQEILGTEGLDAKKKCKNTKGQVVYSLGLGERRVQADGMQGWGFSPAGPPSWCVGGPGADPCGNEATEKN